MPEANQFRRSCTGITGCATATPWARPPPETLRGPMEIAVRRGAQTPARSPALYRNCPTSRLPQAFAACPTRPSSNPTTVLATPTRVHPPGYSSFATVDLADASRDNRYSSGHSRCRHSLPRVVTVGSRLFPIGHFVDSAHDVGGLFSVSEEKHDDKSDTDDVGGTLHEPRQ